MEPEAFRKSISCIIFSVVEKQIILLDLEATNRLIKDVNWEQWNKENTSVAILSKILLMHYIQGDQKVSVHLMITVHHQVHRYFFDPPVF